MSIQINPSSEQTRLGISVSGSFAFSDHRAFLEACESRPTAALIVIDLAHCSDLDSSAIGMLANLEDHARGEGRELRVVGCSAVLKRVIEIVGLGHLLH